MSCTAQKKQYFILPGHIHLFFFFSLINFNLLTPCMPLDGNSQNLAAEYKFLEGKMSFTFYVE